MQAFCLDFPGTWHQMAVMPTAASALRWLRHATGAESEAQFVAGVAFAFLDGQQALPDGGAQIDTVTLVGGVSRSGPWAQVPADVLGRTLDHRSGADVCTAPLVTDGFVPRASRPEALAIRHAQFQRLYAALKPEMAITSPG